MLSQGSRTFVPPGGLGVAARPELCASAQYAMPVRLLVWLRSADPDSALGPRIAFESYLVLAGLKAKITFQTSGPGAPDPAIGEVASATIVPAGERVLVRHAPVRGLPQHRWLTLALFDATGEPLTQEVEVGECATGTREVQVEFSMAVKAFAWLSVRDEATEKLLRVRVRGELVFTRGVLARLAFYSRPSGSIGAPAGSRDLPLIGPGRIFSSREESIPGWPDGDPWVSLALEGSTGQPIRHEQAVGRCVHT
jgi:hypothetical protein